MTTTPQGTVGCALISVSDKTGLVDFARGLAARGVRLVSTGGTATSLRKAGLDVTDVAQVTGFPEIMDGRVKTLHPRVHGGILAKRDDADHIGAMQAHGIDAIDLVVVNLYPFEATLRSGADIATCIENIDIGGPAMIRAAAKNHGDVSVVVDPQDYEAVLAEMDAGDGAPSPAFRARLAQTAFARTAAYDAAVSGWMARIGDAPAPRRRAFAGELVQTLRYGENPHQSAAFYRDGSRAVGVANAVQHQGKELSYNNIADTDAAFSLASDFASDAGPACVIVKHANPCGVAIGATPAEAYRKAFDCDRTSAFGGIVALNTVLDAETATAIAEIFTEVVIAPEADAAAREILAAKSNLRLLTTGGMADGQALGQVFTQVSGGFLVQDADTAVLDRADLRIVTKRAPDEAELADMLFAWRVAKHVKSNAIVYAKGNATVGIGAGQMSRVDSTRIAARKAGDMAEALGLSEAPTRGAAVASDAFFPFPDGLITAAEAGATAVIQPGGSVRDEAVIAAADARGIAMAFTGMRHFRH